MSDRIAWRRHCFAKGNRSVAATALNINQWRNTNDYIKWFKDYDKNDKCSFIEYDIKEFYQ